MKQPCLLIMVPNTGMVHTQFMKSIIELTQSLKTKKIPVAMKTVEFSDIVMSRNYLLSYFLSHEKFSHALFIDSDSSFKPEQFFRLFDFDEEFVAAVYPDRRFTDGIMKALWKEQKETPKDGSELEMIHETVAGAMHYLTTRKDSPTTTIPTEQKDGFHTAATLAGGFSLLKRAVPEKMVQAGVARNMPRIGSLKMYKDAPRFADFFSHLPTDDNAAILEEDQSFCKRWVQGCGGKIWVDGASKITHHGNYAFRGDYSKSDQNIISQASGRRDF